MKEAVRRVRGQEATRAGENSAEPLPGIPGNFPGLTSVAAEGRCDGFPFVYAYIESLWQGARPLQAAETAARVSTG